METSSCPRLGVVDLFAFRFASTSSLTHTSRGGRETISKRGSPGVVLAAEGRGIAAVAVVEEVEQHSMTEYIERQ